jgi:Fe-S oxidoreductase
VNSAAQGQSTTTARPAPRFARRTFRHGEIAATRRDDRAATVVVWPDTFTDAFRPEIAADLVAVLEAAGERVAVPSRWACLYDAGILGLARSSLAKVIDGLEPWTSRGVPVVVCEPSCLATFRDELPALLADDLRAALLASLARSPAEHLLTLPAFDALIAARPNARDQGSPTRAVVHPHCHGRAVGAPRADREILECLGLRTDVLDAGGCGFAGSFGYRAEHEALSRRIGEEQWLPTLRATMATGEAATLVVDGFSCEMQLAHLPGPQSTSSLTVTRRLLGR